MSASEKLDQYGLIHNIGRGRRDFSGCVFTGEISLGRMRKLFDTPSIHGLVFDQCDLGPSFTIGNWINPAGHLSMRGAFGGEVRIVHTRLHAFQLEGLEATTWFEMICPHGKQILLTRAKFPNGFKIHGKKNQRLGHLLDLIACESSRSFYEESTFDEVRTDNAQLGERLIKQTRNAA